jgi:hypothetical protein
MLAQSDPIKRRTLYIQYNSIPDFQRMALDDSATSLDGREESWHQNEKGSTKASQKDILHGLDIRPPVVNFINVLCAHFLYKNLAPKKLQS